MAAFCVDVIGISEAKSKNGGRWGCSKTTEVVWSSCARALESNKDKHASGTESPRADSNCDRFQLQNGWNRCFEEYLAALPLSRESELYVSAMGRVGVARGCSNMSLFRENNAGIVAERGDLVWRERTLAVRAEREIDVRQASDGEARGRDDQDGISRFRRDLGGVDGIDVPRWFWVGQFRAIKSRSMCEVGVERGCACRDFGHRNGHSTR
jgi:hypothetical protein